MFTNDEKVDNLIKSKDGIIILMDVNKCNKDIETIKEQITKIMNNNLERPILLYVENPGNLLHFFENIEHPHHKFFTNDCAMYALYWINRNLFGKSNERGGIMAFNYINKEQISTELTSRTIIYEDMAKQFENATLPLHIWDHFGRLKIVGYSLIKYGYENSIDPNGWLCTNWKKYKTTIGHGHLWNYSLTRFWATILSNLLKKYKSTLKLSPQQSWGKYFSELYDMNTEIHQGRLFEQYYSSDVIFTDEARNNWVPPNLNPL